MPLLHLSVCSYPHFNTRAVNKPHFDKYPQWKTEAGWALLIVCYIKKERDFSSCHVWDN